MYRARRVPALSPGNSGVNRRLVRRVGAEVAVGSGRMALLLVSNTQVECISQPDRVAGRSIAILKGCDIFRDEIRVELPSQSQAARHS